MKRKILLIGPLPPPSGGVSEHVSRLASKINETQDLECAVFDIGKMQFYNQFNEKENLLKAINYFFSISIVHLHISHFRKYFISRIVKLFGKKIVYTQHNLRDESHTATLKLHKIADACILVYGKAGLINDQKTKIIPAYIPSKSITTLDIEIKEQLSKFKTVIAAISTHPKNSEVKVDGKDIYGFDLLLEAYPTFFRDGQLLLLIDSSGTMKEKYQITIEKLKRDGFPILYLSKEVDFNALLSIIGIYIRPTRSDGDSIAIREALNSGVKVLASDCVSRPAGVVTFVNNDSVSLASEMKNLFDLPKLKPIMQHDNSSSVIDIYRTL